MISLLVNHARAPRRAFTLIEVLMAVLVLGIGLLGLAAVLPAVLKQQWDAADSVQGTLAAETADSYFSARPSAAARVDANTLTAVPLDKRFFDIWANPYIDPDTGQPWRVLNPGGDPSLAPFAVVREPAGVAIPADALWLPVLVQNDGVFRSCALLGFRMDVRFSPVDIIPTAVLRQVFIPLADRLYPSDAAGKTRPQFVWDLAVRRKAAQGSVAPGSGPAYVPQPPGYDKVQVALFVRRIDPRITIPRTQTLFENLTSKEIIQPEGRYAVAADANENPTFDGRSGTGAQYSLPVVVNADFRAGIIDQITGQEVRDVISINPATPERFQQASQPGQILVDNLGNIYTVLGLDVSTGGFGVKVTPPVPFGVFGAGGGGGGGPIGGGQTQPRLRQVVFTPQIPAAVKVFEVNQ